MKPEWEDELFWFAWVATAIAFILTMGLVAHG